MIDVTPEFHKRAFGQVISPLIELYVSFNKELNEGEFFTLDKSMLNGSDVLRAGSSDVPAQDWDFYNYNDYSDRLVSINWSRSLEFPYQIQSGMADFSLSNTDNFFTPLNQNSTIGEVNLPARPIRISAGFRGTSDIIPQFAGLTQGLPDIKNGSRVADYHAIDFLYDICQTPLTKVVNMHDVTTDQVIAKILEAYGLAPSQYNLAQGKYTVPFVFFDIGEDAGTALKQLVQSENGYMWLDEKGTVRFDTYSRIANDTNIVATLSDYDIVEISSGELSDIVNHVKISAEVRELQEWQEVYTKSDSSTTVSDSLWTVPANGTREVKCGLSDPCYDIVAPTLGKASSVSWFQAIDEHLEPVTYGITATGEITSNSYIITFKNNRAFPVEISEMKLWGEPAKVIDVLDYDAYDDESVEMFGDQLLEISDNQFFQTYNQAVDFAKSIIGVRKNYKRTLKVSIKGDFSLQLMDMVKIETESKEYDGVYRILGISYKYENNRLTTDLVLNGTSIKDGVFTLNISKLNGEDLIQ